MSALFVIALTTCLNIAAKAQVSNATFEKKIVVTAKSIRIDSLLKVFARQTGVEFSFNTSKISPSKTLAVARQVQTLSQWLTTLRQNPGIQYKVVGNHIILVDNKVTAIPQKGKAAPTAAQTTPPKKTGTSNPSPQTTIVIITDSSQQEQRDTIVHQPILPASSPISIINSAQANSPGSSTSPTIKQQPTPVGPPKRTTASNSPAVQKQTPPRKERTPSIPDDELKQEVFQLVAGYSKHGSGDMKGIVFGAEYTKYLSRKFSLNINIRGTINHDEDKFSYLEQTTNTHIDGSVRFTTAGAQLGINAQLSALRSRHHEIMFSLGGFGRYQSASPDGYGVTRPTTTNPEFLFSFYNWNPQNIVAAGILAQFHYNFTFNNNMLLGIKAGGQTDTEGDVIPQLALSVGKRF